MWPLRTHVFTTSRSKLSTSTFPAKDELSQPCSEVFLLGKGKKERISAGSADSPPHHQETQPFRQTILERARKQTEEEQQQLKQKQQHKQSSLVSERYGWLLLTRFADIEDRLKLFDLSEDMQDPLFKIKKTFAPAVFWSIVFLLLPAVVRFLLLFVRLLLVLLWCSPRLPYLQVHLPPDLCPLIAEYGHEDKKNKKKKDVYAVWNHGDRLVELLKTQKCEIPARGRNERLW